MQRVEREADNVGELQTMVDAIGANLRVAAIGYVVKYDPEAVTVDVQLFGQEGVRLENGDTETNDLPILADVPVYFPHSKDFVMTWPIKPGDECMVVFMDRCIDAWFQNMKISPQVESRMHDLSDGIAFVGPYSQMSKPPNPHTENVQLRTFDGKSYIEMTPDKKMNIWMENDIYIHSDTDIQIEAPHVGFNDNLLGATTTVEGK